VAARRNRLGVRLSCGSVHRPSGAKAGGRRAACYAAPAALTGARSRVMAAVISALV
jgi:hypothetical protein